MEHIAITHILVAGVASKLKRVPDGYYVRINGRHVKHRTPKKAAPIGKGVVEWEDRVKLPLDRSLEISLSVFALFELGPGLAETEVISKFEFKVGELLDRDAENGAIKFFAQNSGDSSSQASIEIKVERQVSDQNVSSAPSDLFEPGNVHQLVRLMERGHQAFIRYHKFQDETQLKESIKHFEHAQDLCPIDNPSCDTVLFNLATAKLIYSQVDGVFDCDSPISLYRTVVGLRSIDHPGFQIALLGLGMALLARSARKHDEENAAEANTLISNILDVSLADTSAHRAAILVLGRAVKSEFAGREGSAETGKNDRRNEKVEKLTAKEDATEQSTTHGFSRLKDFETLPSGRHNDVGDIDLRKAVSMLEEAVQVKGNEHPDLAMQLSRLGVWLLTQYQRFGNVIDLQKSISRHQDVLRLTPDDDPYKPLLLNNIGLSLFALYQRFGDIADLESCISWQEDAVRLTSDDSQSKFVLLINLAQSLSTRYKHFGEVVDMEKSISTREDALRLVPDDHALKPSLLCILGHSLSSRYDRFGDVVDLEKSISLYEHAMRLTPDDHPEKSSRLSDLGFVLSTRYRRFGDVGDLEKSILMHESALQRAPHGHPERPSFLNGLGNSHFARYQHFKNIVDLQNAISWFEEAVQLAHDNDSETPSWLNNLASSLSARYESSGDVPDLEEAISCHEKSVRLSPDDDPFKPPRLHNFAHTLFARYERFGDAIDLDKCISAHESAVSLTPDGHSDQPLFTNDLAFALTRRFRLSGDHSGSDLSRATLYSSHAAQSHLGPSLHRFQASQLWISCVRMSRDESRSLLDSYAVAIHALSELAWIGLPLQNRYHHLRNASQTVCDATATALDANRPGPAVEWLEQGRSIIWNQLLQLRTPADDLHVAHPELASHFEEISHELERATHREKGTLSDVSDGLDIPISLETQAKQHHTLALSRERLLAEIRSLPGFERFLLPKTVDQLFPLVRPGPAVFLNASQHGCDALIVTPGSTHIVPVPLPNTNYDQLVGMQQRLKKLLRFNGRVILRDESNADRGARPKGMSDNDVFGSILPYLWDNVVSPILEVLGFSTSAPTLPRVFWCPTGPFTSLPIHAAGHYGAANPGRKLSDFAISSYIPSLSSLEVASQVDSKTTSDQVRLLAVRQPSVGAGAHLSGVEEEIGVMKALTVSSQFVTLHEADGTVEDVIAKMKASDWVHFACHGAQDPENPMDSGLLLAHGQRLKVSDIVQLSRPRGGLAFLSACQTATGDDQFSEEALHIAAGMLLAGYRGVIATMWTIMDSDAPRVTEDVYRYLFRDGKVPDSGDAAEALHHAIERLRESGAPFLSWVPFIHVGS